jgi:hypothetical protein
MNDNWLTKYGTNNILTINSGTVTCNAEHLYTVTNIVSNGSFENDSVGWSYSNHLSSQIALNRSGGVQALVGLGTMVLTTIFLPGTDSPNLTYYTASVVSGHKYYARTFVGNKDHKLTTIRLYVSDTVPSPSSSMDEIVAAGYNITASTGTMTSGTICTGSGNIGLYNYVLLSGTYVANSTTNYFGLLTGTITVTTGTLKWYQNDGVMLVDLTDAYGAGNEPTAAVMDDIITRMGNYFNGTQDIPQYLYGNYVYNDFSQSASVTSGNLYYFTAMVNPSAYVPVSLRIENGDKTGNTVLLTGSNITATSWKRLSGNFRMPPTKCLVGFYMGYTTTTEVINQYESFYMLIDLTTSFGAGFEPSPDFMDQLIYRTDNQTYYGSLGYIPPGSTTWTPMTNPNQLGAPNNGILSLTNSLPNGSFENTTTGQVPAGWATSGNVSATVGSPGPTGTIGSKYLFVDVGASTTVYVYYTFSSTLGHKYYFSSLITNQNSTLPVSSCVSSVVGGLSILTGTHITNDGTQGPTYQTITGTFTSTSTTMYVGYSLTNTSASFKACGIDGVMIIDLTAMFGMGNEPTDDIMRTLCARLGRYWDGTISPTNGGPAWMRGLSWISFVQNGSFESGLVNWTGTNPSATIEATTTYPTLLTVGTQNVYVPQTFGYKQLRIARNGSAADTACVAAYFGSDMALNHKIYTTCKAIVLNKPGTAGLQLLGPNSSSPGRHLDTKVPWFIQRISGIDTLISPLNGRVVGSATVIDANSIALFDGVMVFDLTWIFGAGNEPTIGEMDAMMEAMGGYFAAHALLYISANPTTVPYSNVYDVNFQLSYAGGNGQSYFTTPDWDFGDGSPHGSGYNVTHTYGTNGTCAPVTKLVTATLLDTKANETSTGTALITVNPLPRTLTALISSVTGTSGYVPTTLTASGSVGTGTPCGTVTYTWFLNGNQIGTGASLSYTFRTAISNAYLSLSIVDSETPYANTASVVYAYPITILPFSASWDVQPRASAPGSPITITVSNLLGGVAPFTYYFDFGTGIVSSKATASTSWSYTTASANYQCFAYVKDNSSPQLTAVMTPASKISVNIFNNDLFVPEVTAEPGKYANMFYNKVMWTYPPLRGLATLDQITYTIFRLKEGDNINTAIPVGSTVGRNTVFYDVANLANPTQQSIKPNTLYRYWVMITLNGVTNPIATNVPSALVQSPNFATSTNFLTGDDGWTLKCGMGVYRGDDYGKPMIIAVSYGISTASAAIVEFGENTGGWAQIGTTASMVSTSLPSGVVPGGGNAWIYEINPVNSSIGFNTTYKIRMTFRDSRNTIIKQTNTVIMTTYDAGPESFPNMFSNGGLQFGFYDNKIVAPNQRVFGTPGAGGTWERFTGSAVTATQVATIQKTPIIGSNGNKVLFESGRGMYLQKSGSEGNTYVMNLAGYNFPATGTRKYAFSCRAAEVVSGSYASSFNSGSDTYISYKNPTVNYGTQGDIWVYWNQSAGEKNYGLIWFNLSSIPNSAVVDDVDLKFPWHMHNYMYMVNNEYDNKSELHMITTTWIETGTTWNGPTVQVAWNTATSANFSTFDLNLYNKTQLIADVQNFVSGSLVNHGWLIKTSEQSGKIFNDSYGSREFGNTYPQYMPKLIVSYHIPSSPTLGYRLQVSRQVNIEEPTSSYSMGTDIIISESRNSNNNTWTDGTAGVLLTGTYSSTPQGIYSMAPVTVNSPCLYDAYIKWSLVNTSYMDTAYGNTDPNNLWSYFVGDEITLEPYEYSRTLISFDLSSISGVSLGANQKLVIDSAKLYMDCNLLDYKSNMTLYKITGNWNETTVTYNNRPSINSTASGNLYVNVEGWATSEDLSADVQYFVDSIKSGSSKNYGWMLFSREVVSRTQGGYAYSNGGRFYPRHASSELRPYLTVTYHIQMTNVGDSQQSLIQLRTVSLNPSVPLPCEIYVGDMMLLDISSVFGGNGMDVYDNSSNIVSDDVYDVINNSSQQWWDFDYKNNIEDVPWVITGTLNNYPYITDPYPNVIGTMVYSLLYSTADDFGGMDTSGYLPVNSYTLQYKKMGTNFFNSQGPLNPVVTGTLYGINVGTFAVTTGGEPTTRLSPGSTYQFRYSYINSDGLEGFSTSTYVQTAPVPEQILGVKMNRFYEAPTNRYYFRIEWDTGTANSAYPVQGYQVAITKNIASWNTATYIASSTITGTDIYFYYIGTTITTTQILPNRIYYIKVRAYNTINGIQSYGDWSDVISAASVSLPTAPTRFNFAFTNPG